MSVLIWVQTVCKDYQQTTKDAASKERVQLFTLIGNWFTSRRDYNSELIDMTNLEMLHA